MLAAAEGRGGVSVVIWLKRYSSTIRRPPLETNIWSLQHIKQSYSFSSLLFLVYYISTL